MAGKQESSKRVSKKLNPDFGVGFWSKNWLAAAILVLLPLLLYFAALRFGYVLDDKLVVEENKFVQMGSKGIPQIFANEALVGYLGQNYQLSVGARYRPLSVATFALEHQLFGVAPGMSHFINILLYGLTALLIFRILTLLVQARVDQKWYLSFPFVAALLFALHPLHTEVVANIKGRDEILALLLALVALYYVLRALSEKKVIYTVWAGLSFLLAMFSKENAITYVAVIPLLVVLFQKGTLKQAAIQTAPLLAGALLYFAFRNAATGNLLDGGQDIQNLLNNPFLEATGSQKSATISLTMAWYLKLLLFPHPLTHDYYPYHVPLVTWTDWRAISGLLACLGLLAVAIWTWKRERMISFAILYYAITLSVVSNIFFPVSLFMNERFLYMPSIGFSILVAWLISEKLPVWFKSNVKMAQSLGLSLIAVIGIGYVIRTMTRVPDWENTYTLNAASIKISSESAYSNEYYAFALYEMSEKENDLIARKKLLDEALPYVDKALTIFPNYYEALGTKTGIMVGYFSMNNQIAPLLAWFEEVQTKYPIDYVDNVLKDLIAFGQHRVEINLWLQTVGYNHFWVAKGDKERALKYIQMLKTIDPSNPNVDRALANIAAGIR